MKHLSKFLLALVLVFSFTSVNAQDANNPWAISIGVNAVDFYPTGNDAPLGDRFNDFFNAGDHWNFKAMPSRLSFGRYIGGGFVFELAGSMNQIDSYGDEDLSYLFYYAADGSINYSLRALLNDGWLDPVIGIGAGYTWMEDQGDVPISGFADPTVNGKLGFNIWFSDNVALNIESNYKHALDIEEASHFQHVAGIKFIFGGIDSDDDGVYDKDDECPESPGLPEFNGCPDSDGDGIEDRRDNCPNEAGLAQFDGCPDTDGDGIADPQDDCPEVAGLAELNGCPDADGDGVPDSEDDCPNEAGPEENNGCPFEDQDNDGVLDKDDECPDTAGTVENNGCPEPTAEAVSELNEYSNTVLFNLNQATIRSDSEEALQAIADIMEEYPNTIFHIEGHTDSTGSSEYNEQLSRERAEAVRDWLIDAGIPDNRLTAEGYGEERPIATNSTSAGRQENRRVEISLDQEREMSNDDTETDTINNQN